MNIPTLSRADLTTCKSCLDKIDRAIGYLQYAKVLGQDVREPLNQLAGMRNGIVGVIGLSQKTEQDLAMLETETGLDL